MSKTMEDYGFLDKNQNLTERAIEIYITHCEDISLNGTSKLPFSCGSVPPNPNAKLINLRDKKRYKSFHDNWVQGTFADAVRSINFESQIASPVFDPMALSAKVGGFSPPQMSLDQILALFVSTQSMTPDQKMLVILPTSKEKDENGDLSVIDPTKIPVLAVKIANEIVKLITPPPGIPDLNLKIPPAPPIEYPGNSYEVPKFNIIDIKQSFFLSLPKVAAELFGMFSDPKFLVDFASAGPSEGPLKLFEASCKVMNKTIPSPPGENSTTAVIYQAAVVAALSKPMASSVLGTVIGSAENGVVGGLGGISPDPAKIPVEENKEISNEDTTMKEPISLSRRYYPARGRGGLRPKKGLRIIVVHSTEGNTAAGAAIWFQHQDAKGSAQVVVGSDGAFRCIEDETYPWGAEGANRDGLHIEVVGFAKWSRSDWTNKRDDALEKAASVIGSWSAIYNIPLEYIEGDDIKNGISRGVTTHAAVVKAFRKGDHTDPGEGFPMQDVLNRAAAYRRYILNNRSDLIYRT